MPKLSEKIGELFKILMENFLILNKRLNVEDLFEKKDDLKQIYLNECYLVNLSLVECKFKFLV